MTTFLTVLHIMVCVVIIVSVLLQRGKGAEIGAVFGGGASTTVFGARGAGNFLTKLTTGSAVVFMLTSLTLAYFGRGAVEAETLLSPVFEAGAPETPAGLESPFGEVQESAPAASESESPFGEVNSLLSSGIREYRRLATDCMQGRTQKLGLKMLSADGKMARAKTLLEPYRLGPAQE